MILVKNELLLSVSVCLSVCVSIFSTNTIFVLGVGRIFGAWFALDRLIDWLQAGSGCGGSLSPLGRSSALSGGGDDPLFALRLLFAC